VDYTGLVNNAYNQQVSQYNAGLGGLFGLGAAAIKFSDRRLKKDIIEAGKRNGLPWYGFRYVWEDAISPLHFGYMADEVMDVAPEAVHTVNGFHAVDYDMLEGRI